MVSASPDSPHYSSAADRLNRRGGLAMHFGPHGPDGTEWVRHIDALVPERAAFFHEGFSIHAHPDDPVDQTRFGRVVKTVAAERCAVVLPGGYAGDLEPSSAVGFRDGELGNLLRELQSMPEHLISDEHIERYVRLNAIREMRAAVGSIAWLAVHLDQTGDELEGRPVSLWGTQHVSSLPDMYDRLGVEPLDISIIGDDEYQMLPPHASDWTDDELQRAFEQAYHHAVLHRADVLERSADID